MSTASSQKIIPPNPSSLLLPTTQHIASLNVLDDEDRPVLVKVTVADFGLAEVDAAKHDFCSALPSAFSEVVVTLLVTP